ncbi:hypothetical protein DPX16_20961 [Anabarilius grahami]|uniref:Uncharacterized protein n=1 Tax=Anabarilius grahami TaxID=495550 RepID=A0A3N0YX26_ANAGA|nr:hypothetical protein DPX16_20961 [Anabarilius grahami]
MKIRCPLHINKQKARNSCSTHALNNLTAMNNFSYCVSDRNNFSPGYILKVNLKELDGADKFIHGHTDKCKPTWKTGRREGQAICWEASTGRPRLIKSLLGEEQKGEEQKGEEGGGGEEEEKVGGEGGGKEEDEDEEEEIEKGEVVKKKKEEEKKEEVQKEEEMK